MVTEAICRAAASLGRFWRPPRWPPGGRASCDREATATRRQGTGCTGRPAGVSSTGNSGRRAPARPGRTTCKGGKSSAQMPAQDLRCCARFPPARKSDGSLPLGQPRGGPFGPDQPCSCAPVQPLLDGRQGAEVVAGGGDTTQKARRWEARGMSVKLLAWDASHFRGAPQSPHMTQNDGHVHSSCWRA